MKTGEARDLGQRLCELVDAARMEEAYSLLAPILAEKIPFRLLDVIGVEVGQGALEPVNAFLEHIASHQSMGGWVVIASALGAQLNRDYPGVFKHCRRFIVTADVWYATDILGERVPGPALVMDLERALTHLTPWRVDENRWVRRTVGVAVHFWAKRSQGRIELMSDAYALLDFIAPLFEERDLDAIKGVGWGLKTLGKHYPNLLVDWLEHQKDRPYRALMMKKALTYLSNEQRRRVVGT